MELKSRSFKLESAVILLAALVLLATAFLLALYLRTERQNAELSWRSDTLTDPVVPVDSSSSDYPKLMFYKDGVLVVNKKHGLPSDYSPGENEEALASLKNLIAAGRAAGVDLINSWSGFRSYETQALLYSSYVAQDGVALVDTYSARPGFSEHQTGLAFDLKDSTGDLYRIGDSTYDPATDWVALHAHEYGFIVRYFDATQAITGYGGEPWHLRYLGIDLAGAVYNSGLTLEEYLGVPGGGYVD
ncbi:M15 family metallopeptidase [Candidatus Saccharibacteria bacterium]|nr:M15 family metallopeptidase [Candidatus Saccharibacteria bacterium]